MAGKAEHFSWNMNMNMRFENEHAVKYLENTVIEKICYYFE